MTIPERLQFRCNTCKQSTWHQRLFTHARSGVEIEDGDWETHWEAHHSTWKCCGCDAVTFRVDTLAAGDPDPYVSLYPPRNTNVASQKLYLRLPVKLDALYKEVIDTFNDDSRLLCAAGLRALLEGVCVNKGITEGPTAQGNIRPTLEGKINGLKAVIAPTIAENLHGFRFLGNTAVHELERPQREDLALAIEVIEDILNLFYELDYKTDRLHRQVKEKKKEPKDPTWGE